MPKVFTQFDRPKTIPAHSGDEWLTEYQEAISKTGEKILEPIGKKNIYDMIQAELESTKIENILHAVAMGDLSALQQREAMYLDATSYPKSLMEMQNMIIKAKDEFLNMPLEVRKLFNNSAEQYVGEMGTKEFFEKMAPYNKKIAEIEQAGNLKEYNKKVADQAKFETDVANYKGAQNEQKQ